MASPKKARMGDAGRDVLRPAEPVKRWQQAVAPATKLRPISADTGAARGVMFMLETRHRDALQDAARRLRDDEGGRGRADASRVLRALLEDWLEDGAKLPRRVGEGG